MLKDAAIAASTTGRLCRPLELEKLHFARSVVDLALDKDADTELAQEFCTNFQPVLAHIEMRQREAMRDHAQARISDWVIQRDRLITVPYSAELRDGALIDIRQTDRAENDSSSPRFDDNFDAYVWLYTEELSTWRHITVIPVGDDAELPKVFELRGPDGRVETAELDPPADLAEDWTLEFEATGASISSTYDHTARVALGRHDSFEVFAPASLGSRTQQVSGPRPEPYTALARVWAYLIALPGSP